MAKKAEAYPHTKELGQYEGVIASVPGLIRGGASMPYTSLNGHMFSFLNKEGFMALRLPEELRDKFTRKYKPEPCIEHGTVMKEYVRVPASLFGKTKELGEWFRMSHDYVKTLKPKPTKK